MDNVKLSLLSTARHHQRLEEFQPLSQNAEGDGDTSQASLRGGKRRGLGYSNPGGYHTIGFHG